MTAIDLDKTTGVYLTTANTPTAYIDPRSAELGDLEYHELHFDGKPAPSHLMHAVAKDGDRILTASPGEMLIWIRGREITEVNTVELVS